MRIDVAERRRLELERIEQADQDGVFEDVGKVAGMEGVAIVHRAILAFGATAPAPKFLQQYMRTTRRRPHVRFKSPTWIDRPVRPGRWF